MKGQYGPVELTEDAVNTALWTVEQQIQTMRLDPNDLTGSFDRFAARQQPEFYRQLRPDSSTIGPNNESRYEYARRCTREVMKAVKWRVQQELEWRNATAQLGLYDEKNNLKQISPNRFLDRLMKTGGTAEDRQFNEAVVALAALANGDITEEKYLELRRKYHAARKTEGTPKELAKRDLADSAEFIYQAVERKINDDSVRLNRYLSAAATQSGVCSGFEHGMEEAFTTFRSNATELRAESGKIFEFLNKLGLKNPAKDRPEEKRQHWLDEAMEVLQIKEAAEQTANPCFALLDPFKHYRAFNVENGGGFLPEQEKRQPQDTLAYALLENKPAF